MSGEWEGRLHRVNVLEISCCLLADQESVDGGVKAKALE